MSINHFTRFGEEARPWLDAELLQSRFFELSALVHPDKATSGAEKESAEREFAALNKAHEVLRHPRSRVLHLLEILGCENGVQTQAVPASALNLFPEVAKLTKKGDDLLREKNLISSPMLKVRFFESALELVEQLQQMQRTLRARIGEIEEALRALDAGWDFSAPPPPEIIARLKESAAEFGFLERWNAQLDERCGSLMF